MPDRERQELMDPILVPGVLSYLAYGNFSATVATRPIDLCITPTGANKGVLSATDTTLKLSSRPCSSTRIFGNRRCWIDSAFRILADFLRLG